MASFDGVLGKGLTADATSRIYYSGGSTSLGTPPHWQDETLHGPDYLKVLDPTDTIGGPSSEGSPTSTPSSYAGDVVISYGEDFFDRVLVFPRTFDYGIILATQSDNIDVYSSYRTASRTWSSYANNAGAGITIPDLPSLPSVLTPQSGVLITLQVDVEGPPTIDGTLDFTFDTGLIQVALTGQRAIVLPVQPIVPLVEHLQFRTDVIVKRNGTEQRRSLRETPRQVFDARFQPDGFARRLMESILFDGHGRAVGFPMWHEPSVLASAISVSDTVATVDSTAYADWRVDGLGIVWESEEQYETLEVASYTSTSVTFSSAFTKAFSPGALVMPVRTAYYKKRIGGRRHVVNLQEINMTLWVSDNDVDLSDASAFGTYNSKVFLDEANMVDGSRMREFLENELQVVDAEVGKFQVRTNWDVSRRGHVKGFFSNTRQRLWEIRQLLHALKGRTISFYIPTFFPDLEPTAALVDSSDVLTIRNAGYAKFVRDRQPKDVLQVVLNDGTKIVRAVVSSAEVSDTTEQITVDSAWGVNAAVDAIDRVEFVEKVRIDSDRVEIRHLDATGQAEVKAPIKAVLE